MEGAAASATAQKSRCRILRKTTAARMELSAMSNDGHSQRPMRRR
jgi:hypothetical protein